jgi:hypothetical protein
MDFLKVEGHSSLVRDRETNSIINPNMSEYNDYIARKSVKNEEKQKIQKLEDELASIRGDLDVIKNLLRGISNGSK